jgi:hypothetical protein
VSERRFRVGSLVEWVAAAGGVALVVWLISVPVQRALGTGVEASVTDIGSALPPGVPGNAISVPTVLLLDGRQVRVGELHTRLSRILPESPTDPDIVRSTNEYGERHTRAYVVDGMKFYVVCERSEPNAPLRVAGIYLP